MVDIRILENRKLRIWFCICVFKILYKSLFVFIYWFFKMVYMKFVKGSDFNIYRWIKIL